MLVHLVNQEPRKHGSGILLRGLPGGSQRSRFQLKSLVIDHYDLPFLPYSFHFSYDIPSSVSNLRLEISTSSLARINEMRSTEKAVLRGLILFDAALSILIRADSPGARLRIYG